MNIENVRPVPWGIMRCVLAPLAVMSGLAGMGVTFVFGLPLTPSLDSVAGWLARLGLLVAGVSLYLAGRHTAAALVGNDPMSFYNAVGERNWHGYRAHIWRLNVGGGVVWDLLKGYESPEGREGFFSISAKLSGKGNLKQTLIYDWRAVRQGTMRVRGLYIGRVPITSMHCRVVTDTLIELSDNDGVRIRTTLGDALGWWIPQAMTEEGPSLTAALDYTRALLRTKMQTLDAVREQLASTIEQRERIIEGRDNLQQRFEEQHALADTAIDVIRQAIWDIYQTRRLDGIRSRDGRSVREKLTDAYRQLAQLRGHDKHNFQLNRLPPEPGQRGKRLPAGDREGIESMP